MFHNNYKKICLMLPTCGRSKSSLPVFLKSALDTARTNICFAFCVSEKDKATSDFLNKYDFRGHDYIVIRENLPSPNLAVYFNMLYDVVSREWPDAVVSMVGDDMEFLTRYWDEVLLDEINKYNGIGVFWCNDDYIGKDLLAVNLFVTQDFIKLTGRPFMCGEFAADMIDVVWTAVGKNTCTDHYLPGVVIRHNHSGAKKEKDITCQRLMKVQQEVHDAGGNARAYEVAGEITRTLNENGVSPEFPGLDILVCSLNCRVDKLQRLMDTLGPQCKGKPVQVIVASDDGLMNIGEKRNFLLAQSKRKYVVFVDDDDMVPENYVYAILEAIAEGENKYGEVDCIATCGYIIENGIPTSRFELSKNFKKWYRKQNGTYIRTPNHISPIRSAIAKRVWFSPISSGEDKVFSDKIKPYLKTETSISEPMYYYVYWNKNDSVIPRNPETKKKTGDTIYSQNDEQQAINAVFGDKGRFLDVGAYDGKTFSNTLRLYERGWSGVLFEPSPVVYSKLTSQYAGMDRVELVRSAVALKNGEIDFYDSNGEALSTTNPDHLKKWYNTKFTKTNVPCITWNALFDKYGTDFDFINLDTESTNWELMQAFPWERCTPKCFCVEYDNYYQPIMELLESKGYRLTYKSQENIVAVKTDTCLVTFGKGKWYPEGAKILGDSFKQHGYIGDFLNFSDESQLGCDLHSVTPYAFKAYAVKKAYDMGYKYVLWCDCAIRAIKDVNVVFDYIKENGYLLLKNGWNTGEWCADSALEPLGKTREQLMLYPHLMACVMGFDFSNEKSIKFLEQWYAQAKDGRSYRGAWTNKNGECSNDKRVLGHRHDQTVGSVISWDLGMRNWMSGTESFVHYHNWEKSPDPACVLLSKGGL